MEYYFAIFVQRVTEFSKFLDHEIRKFCHIVYEGYSEPLYVFLQGVPVPYRYKSIRLDAIATPPVQWFYNPETRLFRKHLTDTEHPHRLPWLTAEIKQGSHVLYDLSDWMNGVRWQGIEGTQHPGFREILAAWTLESGIVVAHRADLNIECFNEEGDMVIHTLTE